MENKKTNYKFCAHTNSTDHQTFSKSFKSELALKRYLNKFLREYGLEEVALVGREDGRRCFYNRNTGFSIWN